MKINNIDDVVLPCESCEFSEICKYKNAIQINFNKDVFNVMISCKVAENTRDILRERD